MFTRLKMRRYRRLVEELEVGMSGEQIRAILGEPVEILKYEDEVDFDEIWKFEMPQPHYYFEIALKNTVYSHAWWGQGYGSSALNQTET